MDIDIVIDLLQGLVQFLDEFREQGFASAMDEATQMASKMGIEPKFREKLIIRRKKQFDESDSDNVTQSGEEAFRVEYFLFIIDQARSSLKVRFEQFKQYQKSFGFLLNLDKLKSEPLNSLMKSCMELQQFLSHGEHSDINGDELYSELMVMRCYITNEKRAIDMMQFLAKLHGLFPNTYIAYKILLTIPVTVASAERSFSKLKLIKNYLRSTMSQERLNGLAMLSIEKEMVQQLDYTDLINIFASKTARRIVFM
ncbi:uncharacterized protein [Primulina eburnea]|uniref:uncharacterized protein n=1 Tax=Primulina eburnea TaxID=1245227 RepID=UPI003C6C8177